MSARIFSPFLMLLARLTDPELTRAVQFLKEENKVLRSRLGKKVQVTRPERRRLLKVAEPLGDAIKELIIVVTYRTFLRWKSDAKKGKKKAKTEKRKRGRPQAWGESLCERLLTCTHFRGISTALCGG